MEQVKFTDLKIVRTEIFKLPIPLKKPFKIALDTISETRNTVVKIYTNQEGLYGIGEVSPTSVITGDTGESNFELAKSLAQLLKNRNPLEIEDCIALMEAFITFNPAVISAFDMALYDIAGKYTHLPVYALLGGKNDRNITTDMTVGMNSPEEMARDALAFKEAGFPAIKVKLGEGKEKDIARIDAIRKAIGWEIPLRIDANQGWDTVTAVNTLKALEKYNIEHCEEPVSRWNNSGMAYVRSKSPIPIMADESVFDMHDAYRLASMEACDFFNIKLAKSGGLNNALKIIAVAEASGIKCQVGCMSETRVGLTALTHLAVARKNIVHFDIDSALMHLEDPVAEGISYCEKGIIKIPDTPGLGTDFKSGILDKLEKTVIE